MKTRLKIIFAVGVACAVVALGAGRMSEVAHFDPPVAADIDRGGPLYEHRTVTSFAETASTAAYPGSAMAARLNAAPGRVVSGKLFPVRGSKALEMRVWASDANTSLTPTCNNDSVAVTVVGVNRGFNNTTQTETLFGAGETLLTATATIGTSQTAGYNPISGAALSAPGDTYLEADTWAVTLGTGSAPQCNYTIFDGGGDNRQARIVFDPNGMEFLWVFVTNTPANANEIKIALRHIQ